MTVNVIFAVLANELDHSVNNNTHGCTDAIHIVTSYQCQAGLLELQSGVPQPP